jgi:hypothetical protein
LTNGGQFSGENSPSCAGSPRTSECISFQEALLPEQIIRAGARQANAGGSAETNTTLVFPCLSIAIEP